MGLFDKLFGPKYNKSDSYEKREEAVKKINDESVLADIAKNDSERDVCIAAVKKISGKSVLADIAKNASDWNVREVAVGKISDESVLVDIAKNDSDVTVRQGAVKKISNESILIDIAKNNSMGAVRQGAVRRISDESVLVDIAKNDSINGVRKEAVGKISDESVLVDIAKNDSSNGVRDASLGRLRKLNPNSFVCITPEKVSQINDQSKLINIAQNAADPSSRKKAIGKIIDDPTLINRWSYDGSQNEPPVGKISDESVLVDIAKNDSDRDVRLEAVRRIGDVSVLADIAKNASNDDIRKEAINKISDESVLVDIAKNESINNLKEFEKLNNSTSSIYNLDNNEVLFIDGDGNNYLSWEEYDKVIRKKKDKIQTRKRKKHGQWAKGNERDVSWSDGIIFISENFKNTNKLPKYVSKREFVDQAVMLNPMTDRRTEGEKYYLYTFNNIRVIVINGLELPNSLNLNDIPAKTIVFKNCDFSNLNETNIIYDGTSPKIIFGDESSINPIIEVLPENCMYLEDINSIT